MALSDWDFRYPVELQNVPWDCAAASLSWALQAAGIPLSEAEVVAGLGPRRISRAFGLLDATGAGLVEYLAEIGVTALNDAEASFEEVLDAAGSQPMVIGGREWCHWTGVRISTRQVPAFQKQTTVLDNQFLALANPAPGWDSVQQLLGLYDFMRLGVFSAVWFTDW